MAMQQSGMMKVWIRFYSQTSSALTHPNHFKIKPSLLSLPSYLYSSLRRQNRLVYLLLCSIGILAWPSHSQDIPSSPRAETAIANVSPALKKDLSAMGFEYGAPLFIRIFKLNAELEVWLQKGERFELFRRYDICYFSGKLGPKTRQGDKQAPEGFYWVSARQLNPWSRFHLSFDLGYPNAYDRAHGYTGGALMVHGDCVSVGCYAMTDEQINEIYALAYAAFEHGQTFFRVHSLPFHLNDANLSSHANSPWFDFWENLKQGSDFFETYGIPPEVSVRNGRYYFSMPR